MTKFKNQVKNLNQEELAARAREMQKQLAKTKLELKIGKVRNNRQLFILRKQLAIIKTYENNHR